MAEEQEAEPPPEQQQQQQQQQHRVRVFVSSSRKNAAHRRAIRNTWLRFLRPDGPESNILTPQERARVTVRFVVSRKPAPEDDDDDGAKAVDAALDAEAKQHGDIFFAATPEGYGRLWAKALEYLRAELELEDAGERASPTIAHFFHADDDSYVRLDLLLRDVLSFPPSAPCARARFYWGYVWNSEANPGARTSPIRDPRNKSHMPVDDYPFDAYPPFCSGCGFALSRDLAAALVRGVASGAVRAQFRVLDPPFGVYLCGPPPPEGWGLFERGAAVVPVHDARVRPYRALPLFDASTVVQHYARPEEMRPFHAQVMEALEGGGGGGGEEQGAAARGLYAELVGMGLLRR
jgi:hypothetical protein